MRVLDQSSDFLKELTEKGIEIETILKVLSVEADQLCLSIGAGPSFKLAIDLARLILVK